MNKLEDLHRSFNTHFPSSVFDKLTSKKIVYLDETKEYIQPALNVDFIDVELYRKLYAGEWNTFCLPFPLSASQITETWGENTKVAELVSISESNIIFGYCNEIEAGKPCLIFPERVNEATHIYKFTDIDANTWAKSDSPEYIIGDIKFVGFYSPTLVKKGSYALGDVNVLYHLDIDMNSGGYHCYLEDITGTSSLRGWRVENSTTE